MSTLPATPSISVVVPVYGCDTCLSELCRRLSAVLTPITDRFELILVDDRSPDDSWSVICRLRDQYPQVRGLRLSRNFGQQIAITAGLQAAAGDVTVVMDCDLQDPPEKIPEMLAAMREGGHELVLARRIRRSHSAFRLVAAKVYFGIMSRMAEERIDGSYGTFSLLSRKVVDAFLRFTERERHYLFILRWLGFSTGTVEYEHGEREIGRSSYSFGRLVRHAIDGLFFQATVLLRWIVMAGLTFALAGLAAAAVLVYRHFMVASVPGWTSVVVLILLCTGALLVSMGVIGLYIGKIFDQSKARPLFVVDTVDESRLR
jgi:polyisoprenyl-phosphate glycosyltransferase